MATQEIKLNLSLIKKTIVHLLSLLSPKEPFGSELFDAICRLTVTVAIEAIPWRINPEHNDVEILLIRRKPDEAYAGLLHTPGTAMRCDEDVERDTIPRLLAKELGGECEFGSVQFVGNLNNTDELRGHYFTPVYIAEVIGEPANGEWWPIDNLPHIDDTVAGHTLCLWPMAIRAITELKK